MLYSTLTSKGQTTLPKNIREHLHLRTGDKIEYLIRDNEVVICPVNKSLKDLKNTLPNSKISLTLEEIEAAIKKRPH